MVILNYKKKVEKEKKSERILQHPRSIAYIGDHKTIVFQYVKHAILNFSDKAGYFR